jgi:hypothetical protein
MLRRNMTNSISLGLDDLLEDLQQARWSGDLGKLALIAYCDVRCWARQAGEFGVAERSTVMFTEQPHSSREAFLDQIDQLLAELLRARSRLADPASFTPHGPPHDVFASVAAAA